MSGAIVLVHDPLQGESDVRQALDLVDHNRKTRCRLPGERLHLIEGVLRKRAETQLDAQSLEFLNRMQNAAVRMGRLIEDLLQFFGFDQALERRAFGRLGLYGDDHAQRLALIRELREQGFGIEAIRLYSLCVIGPHRSR